MKETNERDGYNAIITHLKNKHLHELEKTNKRFTEQLQEKEAIHEKNQALLTKHDLDLVKEQHDTILRGVRARQRELLQKSYSKNEALRADIQDLHEIMDQVLEEHNAAIKQAKNRIRLLPRQTIPQRSRG